MPKRIDWAKTAAEWADEVAWLEEHGDVHSREYKEAAANLRTAQRHVDIEREKQTERDRYEGMTPTEVARHIADRIGS
jgi:hypothetical protein